MSDFTSEISEMVEATRSLYQKGASDGLPVVPPTDERVAEMLRGTELSRGHELGRLGNREGILTVEKLAINGVMAGCTPVHMPVLLAGAKALADPEANAIQVSTSTGSWAYCWVVNGPVRGELGIRSRYGPGSRANRAIGRALGLAYKNTAIIHPGEKDMGVQGSPQKFGLFTAENEEASPWEPMHETRGFDADQSTITIGGPNSFAQYTNRHGDDAEGILKGMIYNTPPWMERVQYSSSVVWAIHGLSPDDAQTLHEAGFSKRDVKEYLLENSDLMAYEMYTGSASPNDDDEVSALRPTHELDPEQIHVPVVGQGGGENVVMGPSLPGTVTKPITYPDNWETLREEYSTAGRADAPATDHEWADDLFQ